MIMSAITAAADHLTHRAFPLALLNRRMNNMKKHADPSAPKLLNREAKRLDGRLLPEANADPVG